MNTYTKYNRQLDIISKDDFDQWNHISFKLFYKTWILLLCVELLLFVLYQPNEECSRAMYFWFFIVKPSGIQIIAILFVRLLTFIKRKCYHRRVMYLGTLFLLSVFAASTIWIHTSVPLISMLLMLPLIFATLYKDSILSWLQLLICVVIYVLKELYFYPNSPYLPPLNNFINISIFTGSIVCELFLIEEVQEYVQAMEKRADRDSMTGLYNHRIFYERLDMLFTNHKNNGTSFSLLVIDIDRFKRINDTYGHAFGDDVICRLSEILKNQEVDCFCARYGGEEFAVIFENIDSTAAYKLAEEIRLQFAGCVFMTPDGGRSFSISIGVTDNNNSCVNSKEMFLRADQMLYKAKESGRNRVCL